MPYVAREAVPMSMEKADLMVPICGCRKGTADQTASGDL